MSDRHGPALAGIRRSIVQENRLHKLVWERELHGGQPEVRTHPPWWKDGEPLFLACNVWRDAAEHVAESLQRGARVIVQGRLRQRSYETREGEKRTVYELEVDEIGPSLRYATAKVQKMSRSGGGGGGFGASGGGGGANRQPSGGGGGNNFDDPWATAAPASGARSGGASSNSSFDDEPPF